jgi:hypothetical protein
MSVCVSVCVCVCVCVCSLHLIQGIRSIIDFFKVLWLGPLAVNVEKSYRTGAAWFVYLAAAPPYSSPPRQKKQAAKSCSAFFPFPQHAYSTPQMYVRVFVCRGSGITKSK